MENKNLNLSTLFIVMFLFFICLFSSTPASRANRELKFEVAVSSHSNAAAIPYNHTYSFQETLIPVCKKLKFNLLSDDCKIFADNRACHQQIVFLSKVELLIKPIVQHGFYYRYFHVDTEDVPLIS